jgi:hypothetical protein
MNRVSAPRVLDHTLTITPCRGGIGKTPVKVENCLHVHLSYVFIFWFSPVSSCRTDPISLCSRPS